MPTKKYDQETIARLAKMDPKEREALKRRVLNYFVRVEKQAAREAKRSQAAKPRDPRPTTFDLIYRQLKNLLEATPQEKYLEIERRLGVWARRAKLGLKAVDGGRHA